MIKSLEEEEQEEDQPSPLGDQKPGGEEEQEEEQPSPLGDQKPKKKSEKDRQKQNFGEVFHSHHEIVISRTPCKMVGERERANGQGVSFIVLLLFEGGEERRRKNLWSASGFICWPSQKEKEGKGHFFSFEEKGEKISIL